MRERGFIMTHASRDTSTGLKFEEYVTIKSEGICLTKNNLYKYLKDNNIDWTSILSRKLLPDEAYYNPNTKEFSIYEKKYQQTEGSADEKPQTCGFKIWEYKKIGYAIGAEKVTYTYLLSSWFAQDKYRDMLNYIRTEVEDCDYIIVGD